jgi:hypothetical protein
VITPVLKTSIRAGITGSLRILASGDPGAGPITVSVAGKSFIPVRELTREQYW